MSAAAEKAEPTAPRVPIVDAVQRHPHNPIAWLQAVRATIAEGKRKREGLLAKLAQPGCADRAAVQRTLSRVDFRLNVILPELEAFVRLVLEAQVADIDAAGPGRSIGAQVLRDPDDTAAQLRAAHGALIGVADQGLAPDAPADQALRVASIEGQVELLSTILQAKRLHAKRALLVPPVEA